MSGIYSKAPARPTLGELVVDHKSGRIKMYDGTSWLGIDDSAKEVEPQHFMDTPKGRERLKEMFMDWMRENHPEDLL